MLEKEVRIRKFLRIITLATLGLYVGFMVTETFHVLVKGHDESHCAVCQVAHQTPVISQGPTALQHHEVFIHLVSVSPDVHIAEVAYIHSGRSTPIA